MEDPTGQGQTAWFCLESINGLRLSARQCYQVRFSNKNSNCWN